MPEVRLGVIAVLLLAGYLVGSVPCGLLVARAMGGADLRKAGSGNTGATNALRVLGKKAGVLTLVGDVLKGVAPVMWAGRFGIPEIFVLLVGLATILGHLYSPFLKFKGGKGVATSFGVFLTLAPAVALVAFAIWGVGVALGKYASVGALAAFGSLPFLAFFMGKTFLFTLFATAVSTLVCLRHRENVHRLIHGTEKGI